MPFPNIGPGELILILVIALIILGPGRLPEVAQSLGRSVREFRKAATDVKDAASLEPTQSTTSQAAATSTAPSGTPNQLSGSTEPNQLGQPEPASTASSSGEQHSETASS
jgi:TatA/E family protein of Tat protein translocase